ncbi:MAG TPA: hypothetical protein VM388_02390 [Acidimicrobiales bacterium]|nr:hypothetical protein [Acidimicrobiales bacterium]
MAWTESRSRDEWLAEVRRRGGRLRRRRRVAAALVGALAMVPPLSVAAGFLTADQGREQEVSVAGPAPAGGASGPVTAREVAPAPGITLPDEPEPVQDPAAPTTLPGLSPENLHRRAEPPVPGDGAVTQAPPMTTPPADDPVVRAATTLPPPATTAPPQLTPNQPTAGGLSAGAPGSALAPCPAEGLQLDVVPSKATFSLGETVSGMFFLQTGRAGDCRITLPASFRIEDVATGKVLGTVGATTELPSPARAEPGKMYTSTFSWDQSDCSGATCAQAAPALYQAVAVWSDGGPYRAWGEFRVAG